MQHSLHISGDEEEQEGGSIIAEFMLPVVETAPGTSRFFPNRLLNSSEERVKKEKNREKKTKTLSELENYMIEMINIGQSINRSLGSLADSAKKISDYLEKINPSD